ncbi:hypothetical protein C4D60_Mb06t32350 [Musa balbisiana]|uniref:J domain-containing protein n=1 Tax=Musa balbisiana TaxID=52838 RepID=A0A4S8ITK4_MUSBA|nr:hypothetical protein C4D60_Mb06t32350 [Musa balbisiana]
MCICKTYYQFRFLDLSGSSSCHRSQDSKQEKYRRKNSFLLPLWCADRRYRVVNVGGCGETYIYAAELLGSRNTWSSMATPFVASLSVAAAAMRDQVHRREMVANHPDSGGSHYLASEINEAKDMLVDTLRGFD